MKVILAPMFLPDTQTWLLHHAVREVAVEDGAHPGDAIEVKFVGMTKDSDGWPMRKFQVQILRDWKEEQ